MANAAWGWGSPGTPDFLFMNRRPLPVHFSNKPPPEREIYESGPKATGGGAAAQKNDETVVEDTPIKLKGD